MNNGPFDQQTIDNKDSASPELHDNAGVSITNPQDQQLDQSMDEDIQTNDESTSNNF